MDSIFHVFVWPMMLLGHRARRGEHAIRSAKPKGGIVPEGIAGPNQGRFEEEDGTSPVTTCSTPAKLTPTSGKKQIEVTRDFLGSLCQILVAAAAALMLTILRGRFMQDTHWWPFNQIGPSNPNLLQLGCFHRRDARPWVMKIRWLFVLFLSLRLIHDVFYIQLF